MPEKMARSDPRTLLGRSGMPGAIHPSHIDFRPVQKTSTIRATSGFIQGIPAKVASETVGTIDNDRARSVGGDLRGHGACRGFSRHVSAHECATQFIS